METGSPGSGKTNVPPGVGVPLSPGVAPPSEDPEPQAESDGRPGEEQGGRRKQDDQPGRARRHQGMRAAAPPPAGVLVRVCARRRPAVGACAPGRGALPAVGVSPASR